MKIILIVLLTLTTLFSQEFQKPQFQYTTDGPVTDLLYKNSKLYAATTAGKVNIFKLAGKKAIKTITVPKIKDFLGTIINAKIYSIDLIENKLLLLSQASSGYRELYIYQNKKLIKVISAQSKLAIAKAKFLNKSTVLLALLSNEIISYDIKQKKENWRIQVSMSSFSDFALNEKREQVVVSDESGELHLFKTKNAKLINTFTGQNLDNVFMVEFKNSIIATAGKDRRVAIYNLDKKSAYYKKSSFLVYSVGLSPKAEIVAYSSDEENNITLFSRKYKTILGNFTDNKMTISKILFKNEHEFFVTSASKTINYYKLKEQ